MRLSIRFVLPLLIVLAGIAYALELDSPFLQQYLSSLYWALTALVKVAACDPQHQPQCLQPQPQHDIQWPSPSAGPSPKRPRDGCNGASRTASSPTPHASRPLRLPIFSYPCLPRSPCLELCPSAIPAATKSRLSTLLLPPHRCRGSRRTPSQKRPLAASRYSEAPSSLRSFSVRWSPPCRPTTARMRCDAIRWGRCSLSRRSAGCRRA